jgi:large-conductance mechanosensitive channel
MCLGTLLSAVAGFIIIGSIVYVIIQLLSGHIMAVRKVTPEEEEANKSFFRYFA